MVFAVGFHKLNFISTRKYLCYKVKSKILSKVDSFNLNRRLNGREILNSF